VFDGLKARLDRLFTDAPTDRAAHDALVREALIEARVGLRVMRESLAKVEADLAAEQRAQQDAERRGVLAAEITDAETVEIAARFATKHAEKAAVLAQKAEAQRAELLLAERDSEELTAQLKQRGAAAASDSVRSAWREVESAGGVRPETDVNDELGRLDADRKLRDQAVAAQLAHLKKQLGRD